MQEKDCIVTGFWIEGFGEIEIQYFADDNILLNEYTKNHVISAFTRKAQEIFQIIEKEEQNDSSS